MRPKWGSDRTFRIVPKERIADVSIGTHHLPLTHLIEFLSDAADRILFIGIQPAVVADGEGLSDDVRRAADLLVELLKKEDFGALETL
jgi:hydrogenase 3 maturation protease